VLAEPVAIIPAPAPAHQGSTMRQSLAERGVIMMKENRTVANVPTLYGSPIEVDGQVLVIVKHTQRQLVVGVKLEHPETELHIASAAFIDSDEIEEFLGAIDFIATSAGQMAHDRRDYTEVTYSTKDDVTIGFYQDGLKQQAFVKLGVGSPLLFITMDTVRVVRAAIESARAHADNRRLAWEAR
jgi:hypothetical protein